MSYAAKRRETFRCGALRTPAPQTTFQDDEDAVVEREAGNAGRSWCLGHWLMSHAV